MKQKWFGCASKGCGNPGTVRYTREERGPGAKGVVSRRRLYLCGEHDYALRSTWSEFFKLLDLKHPDQVQELSDRRPFGKAGMS